MMGVGLPSRAPKNEGPDFRPGVNTTSMRNQRLLITMLAALSALQAPGPGARTRLDGVGALVADVPVEKLAEVAAREDVAWVSDDQEVRSLAAVPDNTSHAEVT